MGSRRNNPTFHGGLSSDRVSISHRSVVVEVPDARSEGFYNRNLGDHRTFLVNPSTRVSTFPAPAELVAFKHKIVLPNNDTPPFPRDDDSRPEIPATVNFVVTSVLPLVSSPRRGRLTRTDTC